MKEATILNRHNGSKQANTVIDLNDLGALVPIISGATLKVYCVLRILTGDGDVAAVDVATLCNKSGVSTNTVYKSIGELVKLGLVHKERRPNFHSGWTSNRYTVLDLHQAIQALQTEKE